MFSRILPAGVAVAASSSDVDEVLFEAEEAAVANAVDARRREFRTGRACARAALGQLGLRPQPIPPGDRGAPLWPDGIVGSITHCEGLRAAAVARSDEFAAVGIDAEPNQPLPAGVLGDIALPEERLWLKEAAQENPDVCWDRLLFSIKESIYKVWFPLAQRWLGFEDATVSLQPDGRFSARLLVAGPSLSGAPLAALSGRWLASEEIVLSAIALAKAGSRRPLGAQ